jgi:hypothetical protein
MESIQVLHPISKTFNHKKLSYEKIDHFIRLIALHSTPFC